MGFNTTRFPLRGVQARSSSAARGSAQHSRRPTDDEILGLVTTVARPVAQNSATSSAGLSVAPDASSTGVSSASAHSVVPNAPAPEATPPQLATVFAAHPELRDAWDAAQQFRPVFATPAAAQDAKNQLDELDAMFFSAQAGDHAALASRLHDLSPGGFHGLAQAMQAHAAKIAAQSSRACADVGEGLQTLPSEAKASPLQEENTVPSATVGAALGSPAPAPTGTGPGVPSFANARAGSFDDVVGADRSHRPAPAGALPQQSENAVPSASVAATVASPVVVGEGLQTLPSQDSRQGIALAGATRPAPIAQNSPTPDARRAAQLAFFHSTNSAAVHQIIGAIESQVNHLLPASVSASTKTRIVGEIYRDLGATLRANRQLGQQLRDAFASASGAMGDGHAAKPVSVGSGFGRDQGAHQLSAQRSVVALLVGRAKQALPSIAKRVIGEWTQSVVAANHERLARHDTAAKRVDISGAGPSDGINRKPLSPRDVDYKRLSDSDILNL